MTVHILVEGPSEQVFLEGWAKRLLRGQTVRVHPHQGKGKLPSDLAARPDPRNRALLHQLPSKLRALATCLDSREDRVLVLFDADNDDWPSVVKDVTNAAKTVAGMLRVDVGVAVEETEAFYLGDLRALRAAFPHADMALAQAYEPDSIVGTWELFGKVIGDGGGNKVAWAEAMAARVTTVPGRSRSPSFRLLCKKVKSLADPRTAPQRRT
jgi:hypothetical protein